MEKKGKRARYDFSEEIGLRGVTRPLVEAVVKRVSGDASYSARGDFERAKELVFKGTFLRV